MVPRHHWRKPWYYPSNSPIYLPANAHHGRAFCYMDHQGPANPTSQKQLRPKQRAHSSASALATSLVNGKVTLKGMHVVQSRSRPVKWHNGLTAQTSQEPVWTGARVETRDYLYRWNWFTGRHTQWIWIRRFPENQDRISGANEWCGSWWYGSARPWCNQYPLAAWQCHQASVSRFSMDVREIIGFL